MFKEIDYFDFTQEPGKIKENRKIINDGDPLISVITPYYNAKKYIQQTANSLFNQTFPYWQWIIINDGSTEEGTDEFLEDFKKQDSRIKILKQKNSGPAAARYYGVQNASCDIIFQLDADDLIDKTLLECGYWTMVTNPKATWAYPDSCGFGDMKYLWKVPFNTIKEKKENVVCISSFIRRDKFLELKEYATLPKEVHEDWYMWLNFLAKGYIPVKMGFYGFWYRRLEKGRLSTINKNKDKTKIAEQYISSAGKQIKQNVGAIQYPISTEYDYDSYPKEFDWHKKAINSNDGKRRILFLFPWAVTGGADIFNLNLIKGLKKKGYQISVITTEPHEYMYRQKIEEYVDEFFDLTTFLSRENWAGFIHYIIKTRLIDIVFESNSFYGYYVIPWLKCKFEKVHFVDYLHAEDWSWRDGSYPRDSIAISHYLDRTYTCTKYLKDLMYDKMNKRYGDIKTVYIGTDAKYFNPEHEYNEEKILKEKFKNKKVVLFPCRFVYLKRPIFAVKLLNSICNERKDIVFAFVGDGPARAEMKSYIKEYNIEKYAYFIGMKNDIRPFYKIADVTLICSLVEGLTLTAYESLAMGVPVVSSDVGGQRELIDDNCGKIIKSYQNIEKDLYNYDYSDQEIDEYKQAIIDIVDNKDKKKVEKYCRDKIVKGFSIEGMVDTLYNDFEKIINEDKKIEPGVINNIEIAERYLILFNEYNRRYFYNPDERVKKPTTSQILWRHRSWRILIKVLKKLRIIQTFKKYVLKTDKQIIK